MEVFAWVVQSGAWSDLVTLLNQKCGQWTHFWLKYRQQLNVF